MDVIDNLVTNFAVHGADTLSSTFSLLGRQADDTSGKFQSMARQADGMRYLGYALGGVATGITAIGWRMATTAGEMQRFEIGLGNLLGSASAAHQKLKELKQFDRESPFSFQNTAKAGQMLLGMGVAAEKVIPLMRSVANAVAGVGGDDDQFQRVLQTMGTIQARGRITAMEVRRLALAHIPVYQILQEKLGLTADQVVNIGRAGINSDKAISALMSGFDSKFPGAALKMMNTFPGALTNVESALYQASAAFGDELVPALTVTAKGLTTVIDRFTALPDAARKAIVIGGALTAVATGVGAIGLVGGGLWLRYRDSINLAAIAKDNLARATDNDTRAEQRKTIVAGEEAAAIGGTAVAADAAAVAKTGNAAATVATIAGGATLGSRLGSITKKVGVAVEEEGIASAVTSGASRLPKIGPALMLGALALGALAYNSHPASAAGLSGPITHPRGDIVGSSDSDLKQDDITGPTRDYFTPTIPSLAPTPAATAAASPTSSAGGGTDAAGGGVNYADFLSTAVTLGGPMAMMWLMKRRSSGRRAQAAVSQAEAATEKAATTQAAAVTQAAAAVASTPTEPAGLSGVEEAELSSLLMQGGRVAPHTKKGQRRAALIAKRDERIAYEEENAAVMVERAQAAKENALKESQTQAQRMAQFFDSNPIMATEAAHVAAVEKAAAAVKAGTITTPEAAAHIAAGGEAFEIPSLWDPNMRRRRGNKTITGGFRSPEGTWLEPGGAANVYAEKFLAATGRVPTEAEVRQLMGYRGSKGTIVATSAMGGVSPGAATLGGQPTTRMLGSERQRRIQEIDRLEEAEKARLASNPNKLNVDEVVKGFRENEVKHTQLRSAVYDEFEPKLKAAREAAARSSSVGGFNFAPLTGADRRAAIDASISHGNVERGQNTAAQMRARFEAENNERAWQMNDIANGWSMPVTGGQQLSNAEHRRLRQLANQRIGGGLAGADAEEFEGLRNRYAGRVLRGQAPTEASVMTRDIKDLLKPVADKLRATPAGSTISGFLGDFSAARGSKDLSVAADDVTTGAKATSKAAGDLEEAAVATKGMGRTMMEGAGAMIGGMIVGDIAGHGVTNIARGLGVGESGSNLIGTAVGTGAAMTLMNPEAWGAIAGVAMANPVATGILVTAATIGGIVAYKTNAESNREEAASGVGTPNTPENNAEQAAMQDALMKESMSAEEYANYQQRKGQVDVRNQQMQDMVKSIQHGYTLHGDESDSVKRRYGNAVEQMKIKGIQTDFEIFSAEQAAKNSYAVTPMGEYEPGYDYKAGRWKPGYENPVKRRNAQLAAANQSRPYETGRGVTMQYSKDRRGGQQVEARVQFYNPASQGDEFDSDINGMTY